MIEKYYVYEIYDPRDDLVFYVGKGSGKRAFKHLQNVQNGGRSENKEKDTVIREILEAKMLPKLVFVEIMLSEQAAYDLEEKLILSYGRRKSGGLLTNICLSARPPRKKGKDHPYFGKTWEEIHGFEKAATMKTMMKNRIVSKETRDRMSVLAKERCSKPEFIELLKLSHTGTKRSQESLLKQSKSNSGVGNPMHGRKHTKESRLSISKNHADVSGERNGRAKEYHFTSPIGDIYVVRGQMEKFCKENGFDVSTVIEVAKRGFPATKGRLKDWRIRVV